MHGILYLLDFGAHGFYIGATMLSIKGRMVRHLSRMKQCPTRPIYDAWSQQEPTFHLMASIEECYLAEAECRLIELFHPPLNVTRGGEAARRHTEKSRALMSRWHRNNPPEPWVTKLASDAVRGVPRPWMIGDKNPSKRAEVRAKMSAASKGKPKSPEHRVKLTEICRRIAKERQRHENT